MLLPKSERWCPIKTSAIVLAIVALVAASVALVLLGKVLDSARDIVRILRTIEPSTQVAAGEDASVPSERTRPDASRGMGAVKKAPVREIEQDAAIEEIEEEDAPIEAIPLENAVPDAASAAATAVAEPAAPPVSAPPEPVRCGWLTCPEGQVCCNWLCGFCTPPGGTCSSICGAPSIPISIPCGPNTCNVTEVCCNRSCGTCVPIGRTCSQELCPRIYDPYSAPCGLNTCNVGQECCNPSCGTCVNPGESCSPEPCP